MSNTGDSLSMWQRVMAASGAGIVSALLVNPLDVVKTRMQAQTLPARSAQPASFGTFSTIGIAPWFERGEPSVPYLHRRPQVHKPRSAICSMNKIARREGMTSLWYGTNVALMIAVPLVAIYLPLYDVFSSYLERGHLGWVTPLAAGCSARTVAVLACSPLELLKTRLQAANPGTASATAASGSEPLAAAVQQLRSESQGSISQRTRSLWRGVGATLAKDIPFAGIYWVLLEPTRTTLVPAALRSISSLLTASAAPRHAAGAESADGGSLPAPAAALSPSPAAGPLVADSPLDESSRGGSLPESSRGEARAPGSMAEPQRAFTATESPQIGPHRQTGPGLVVTNALSGAIAAGVGAWATTPLDLAKTHAQAGDPRAPSNGTLGMLGGVYRRGGMRALFVGASPRVARSAMAYAILMSSYELCKAAYADGK